MASTLADILARAKKRAQGNNLRTVKPPMGSSVWRILDGWRPSDPLVFYHDFGQHWIKDVDGNVKVVVGCPRATFEQSCEICDALYPAIKKAPNDVMRDRLNEMRATQQFLVNAVRTDVSDQKVEILTLGKQLFESLLNTISEYDNLFDPEKGQDIKIDRSGAGFSTSYTLTVRSADKSKPVPASLLMQKHDLDEFVREDFAAKRDKAMSVLEPLMGGVSTAALSYSDPALTRAAIPAHVPEEDEIGTFTDEDLAAIDDAEIIEAKTEVSEVASEVASVSEFGTDLPDDADLEEFLKGI